MSTEAARAEVVSHLVALLLVVWMSDLWTEFCGSWKMMLPGPLMIGIFARICETPPVAESIDEITGRLVLK